MVGLAPPKVRRRYAKPVLDLRQLEAFCLVAVTNFSRAATILGCSQPTVTFHVQTLERALGVSLIERRRFSKTVTLTDTGHHIFEYAQRMLALASEMKAVARGRKRENGEERVSGGLIAGPTQASLSSGAPKSRRPRKRFAESNVSP